MEYEWRQLRGVALAGAASAIAVAGLVVWSGGPAPDNGGDGHESTAAESRSMGSVPSRSIAEMHTAATAPPGGSLPPPEAPPTPNAAAATDAQLAALVARLPDPPGVTPVGDVDAPGGPSWLLFDTPVQVARDGYAGAVVGAGLAVAPGPVPAGAAPGSAGLIVTDPTTGAQVLVVFEPFGTDVNVTIDDVPVDDDAAAPSGTVPSPSPEVAAIALLAALPTPESAAELSASSDMRMFRVSGVPFHDVAWAYLAQLQEAGYAVRETDRGEGLLTITVTDAAGGAVTIDLLDHAGSTEIVAFS